MKLKKGSWSSNVDTIIDLVVVVSQLNSKAKEVGPKRKRARGTTD